MNDDVNFNSEQFKKDLENSFSIMLTGELSKMELRLVDRITKSLDKKADQAIVDRLLSRVQTIENSVRESIGSRRAFYALAAIVVTVVVAATTIVIKNVPDQNSISQQIQKEAPWVRDKDTITDRLNVLDREISVLTLRIRSIEKLDEFFCHTRAKANLPTC
jgi:chorismate-pyruvate lyase